MPVKRNSTELRAFWEKRLIERREEKYPEVSPELATAFEEARNRLEDNLKKLAEAETQPIHLSTTNGESIWLYQDTSYRVSGGHSREEERLLILDFLDKERQKFERLKAKFYNQQTDDVKYERTRIPESVRIEVWRRDQGRCARCGRRENLEYDHIVPVSRGGSNTARNVELLCEPCNREKGNRIQ